MFLTEKVAVRQTDTKGKGVFATTDIPAGTIIGDYLGIITESDKGLKHDKGAVYDMWYSDKADVCPSPQDEGVHLINTSCEPNCAMTAIGRHTILFALRKIFPGEELTYDYFLGAQESDCDSGTDNCHCGSDFCRGTIYSNPKAYREWEEYLEAIIGDLPEEPPVAYGKPLPPLEKYPETIDDHFIHPMWGSPMQQPMACEPEILGDASKLRAIIRESGRQLWFPKLGVVVEGIMYRGRIALRHSAEKTCYPSLRPVYTTLSA
jgi:hypothetical protein